MSAASDRNIATRTENLQWRIDQHRDVVVAHDHIHPDRSQCGGIGNCKIMAAEHETEQEIIDYIEGNARAGLRVVVTLERVKA